MEIYLDPKFSHDKQSNKTLQLQGRTENDGEVHAVH